MLHLIKAELIYSLYKVHASAVSILGLVLFGMIMEFNPINLICTILLAQFFTVVFLGIRKENREYKFTLLKLSSREIAVFRLFIVMFIFLMIYLSGLLIHFIFELPSEGFRDSSLELIMFGGIGLMAIFTYLILSDLFSAFQSKTGVVWFNTIALIIIIVVVIITATTIRNTFNSPAGNGILSIILLYLGGLIFAGISYVTYQNKESHLGV